MELSGKKVIILAEEMYNEFELWYPYYRLKEAGAEVVIVGSIPGAVYKGKSGLEVKAGKGAAEVAMEDCDGMVIPGGYAPDHMRRNPAMLDLVRGAFSLKRIVAAICHAGWVLVSAGVLPGRKVTSFFAIRDDMKNAGADWVDAEVVVDENLITSRTPDDLPAFMRETIKALA